MVEPCCLEKLLSTDVQVSVPQSDTGRLVEHTKALERMVLKELGKLPP